jgi:hypothetical protein
MCPFALGSEAARARTLPRYLADPDQAMLPLLMEYVAMSLNPRQGLVPGGRLYDLLADTPGSEPVLAQFEAYLNAQEWAVYEVDRRPPSRGGQKPVSAAGHS